MKGFIALLFVAMIGGCLYLMVESPPTTPPKPTKEISAEVSITESTLTIRNTGKEDWDYVEIYINSLFGYKAAIGLKAGEKASYNLRNFTKKDGLRFDPLSYRVSKIYVGGGDYTFTTFGF